MEKCSTFTFGEECSTYLFRFNKEYIHKKIVIRNLNISEDRSEKYTKDYKNSIRLGQLLFNKREAVQNRQLKFVTKKMNF